MAAAAGGTAPQPVRGARVAGGQDRDAADRSADRGGGAGRPGDAAPAFDIPLLAERLVGAIDWLGAEPETSALPIGLFGASTGGGAALVASVARPEPVRAVVSRGGRPDLADDALPSVVAPTLLVVGGLDDVVIALNQVAMEQMRCETELRIVPGATHLFEESGTLEQVAALARDWFSRPLVPEFAPLKVVPRLGVLAAYCSGRNLQRVECV